MLTVLFTISAVGIFLLVGMKIIELRIKRELPLSVFLGKFDSAVKNRGESLQVAIGEKKNRTVLFIKHELPRHVKYLLFVSRRSLNERYGDVFPNIRGVRELRKDGAVSPYLQDISKHKELQGKGYILEEIEHPKD